MRPCRGVSLAAITFGTALAVLPGCYSYQIGLERHIRPRADVQVRLADPRPVTLVRTPRDSIASDTTLVSDVVRLEGVVHSLVADTLVLGTVGRIAVRDTSSSALRVGAARSWSGRRDAGRSLGSTRLIQDSSTRDRLVPGCR